MKGMLYLRIMVMFLLGVPISSLWAQTVTITLPAADPVVAVTNQPVSLEATRSDDFTGSGFIYSFTWSATPSSNVNFSPASTNVFLSLTSTTVARFSAPGTYVVTCTVQRGAGTPVVSTAKTVIVYTPNLYSAVNINAVRAWNINPVSGAVLDGPTELFTPLVNTAALAKNKITPTDPTGCLYYLENTNFSNNGTVNLYAVNPDGTGNTHVATTDINGTDNAGLGFVRLGFDADGAGWIVAGDFTNLYLAKFTGNGTAATAITTVGTITISGSGSANEFQNGDLAISGTGAMYIVANITGGETYVYVMNDLTGPTYSLARRWKLVQPGGANFTVSVNGVAFTQSGSLHVSSFQGLYFIDQTTANSNTGTVECIPVYTLEGLTDLASDQFPLQSALPVTLLSFSGNLRNNVTSLSWEVENEINFSHYEIERKNPNSAFAHVATLVAGNNTARTAYQYNDDVNGHSENVFFYRLKMVDLDGKFKYSNTIMVRKDERSITRVSISPNPITSISDVTIRYDAVNGGKVKLTIIDASGRAIWSQHNQVSRGMNSISLSGQPVLLPGVYFLQLVESKEISALKFSVGR